jgi:deoxyribose-phosphate aldolase
MVDITAVRAENTEAEIRSMVELALRYRCINVCSLPCHTALVKSLLGEQPDIHLGGTVGFPGGGHTTHIKVAEARELLQLGCTELDMVIAIGLLRSGQYQRVLDDIRGVVEAAGEVPVKVILECYHLSDDEIRRGCELCIQAGAAWVKTGTGWTPTGATLHNVALIRACVGDAISIKASGGIRTLATIIEMSRLGARRFGLGVAPAARIFEECAAG